MTKHKREGFFFFFLKIIIVLAIHYDYAQVYLLCFHLVAILIIATVPSQQNPMEFSTPGQEQ